MFNHCYRVFIATGLLALVGFAHAVDVKLEFSAEAAQMAPQRPTMLAQMYVSKKAVRTESNVNNQQYVEIVFPEEGRRVMLMPQQRSYMEQSGLPTFPAAKQKKNFSPCAGVAGTTCKKLGTEKLQGRQTEKWQITDQREGRSLRSLHWIDIKRRMPLREKFADGTLSEIKILKKEKINGRNTEKWQLSVTRSNGQSMQSTQWYDTQLKMVIREEMPGGYIRELRKIKVAKQAKELFDIPAGYQRRDAPSPTMGMSRGMPTTR